MLENDLLTFGFDQKESQIYLALLELGEAGVLRIAQKSKVKRTTVYHVLENLKKRGLIGTVAVKKKKLYFAQTPKRLASELDEKKGALEKIMPELLSISNLIEKKPKIQYFDGIGGIKTILEDELSAGATKMMGWCTENYCHTIGEEYFETYFTPKRIAQKIYFNMIAPESDHYKKLQKKNTKMFWTIKMMHAENIALETDIIIYGKSKTSLISYNEKIGLIIDSQSMHNTLKTIFESQWHLMP
ncbi:MAG: helix-turn-helix domain-containing protein [Parcubacteria group bacterium]|jgi:predicted DNA-binding transcriptional regulator